MNKIYMRKIILLCAVAVLLAVYILQLAFSGKNKVTLLTVEENIDQVVINNSGTKLSISKNGDDWFIGEEKLPCQANRASGIVNAIKEIKVLGNVASGSEADNERYGFDNEITVEAYSGEKLVRTLLVGKNTATGGQCYGRIDGKNSVKLLQGALRTTFEVTADGIVEKKKDSAEENPEKPSEDKPSEESSVQ